MNPFNTALLKSPKWSTFSLESSNKLSWSIGNLIPIKKYYLDAGDRLQCDLGQLTRFNPLQAPVMDQYELSVDAFFVPTRVLQSQLKDGVFTKFWNYSDNLDGTYKLPTKNVLSLLEEVNSALPYDCPLSESLYDYLGYPTFPNAYKMILDFVQRLSLASAASSSGNAGNKLDILPTNITSLNSVYNDWITAQHNAANFSENDFVFNGLNRQIVATTKPNEWRTYVANFHVLTYLLIRYYGLNPVDLNNEILLSNFDSYKQLIKDLDKFQDGTSIDWVSYFNFKKIDSDSFFKAYYQYVVYGLFLEIPWTGGQTAGLVFYGLAQQLNYTEEVNDIYLRAYWRIVADWYTNLNVTGYTNDEQYNQYIYAKPEDNGNETPSQSDFVGVEGNSSHLWTPFKRNWKNDYFTSAFPNPQSGTAVNIPSNGTISDLRASAIWQTVKEIALYAGKRAIDTWRAVRGVVSSNARFDMSEPLRRLVFNVDINAITQTNQADISSQLKSPVASWSGQGISAGSKHFIDYTSEEPGIIMILASIRPMASYFQGLDRFLTKGKSLIDDYVYPKMSKVGEQAINNTELFMDVPIDGSESFAGTFGYTRRYAEFMFDRSEVHGEFKTSLDFWHSAREFDTMPTLGTDFLSVDTDRDNLNRVFATSNTQNVYSYFFFDTRIVRALPKYINYGF